MASKRQGAKRTAGRRKGTAAGSRPRAKPRRPAQRGARAGAREARPSQAALEVAQAGPRLVPLPPAEPDPAAPPTERKGDGQRAARASEAPGFVGEELAAGEGEEAAERAAEAQWELSRRREEAASHRQAGEEYPGMSEVGIEIAIGVLRLARTVLTAPLRLALAFLRAREA